MPLRLDDFIKPLLIIYAQHYHEESKKRDQSILQTTVPKIINTLYLLAHPDKNRGIVYQRSSDISSSKRGFADAIAKEARTHSCWPGHEVSYVKNLLMIMGKHRQTIASMTKEAPMDNFDDAIKNLQRAITQACGEFRIYQTSRLKHTPNSETAKTFATLAIAKAGLLITRPKDMGKLMLSLQRQQDELLAQTAINGASASYPSDDDITISTTLEP